VLARIRSAEPWTQGALALEIWEEFDRLPPDMPSSRPNGRRRVERREARTTRRARRFALLILLAAVLVVSLLFTAFGGSSAHAPLTFTPSSVKSTPTQTRPSPEIVAIRGDVRLQLPVAQQRVTAIGYHAANDGALSLTPAGHQANEGLVQRVVHTIFGGNGGGNPRWYELGGGTSALDVGAAVGTSVYSPVDGTVVAITPFVVEGRRYGSQIDIEPQSSPSRVVAVTQVHADPSITVGSSVVSGATRIGSVVDLAAVESQALSRYTTDSGNHVTIEVRTAATLPTA